MSERGALDTRGSPDPGSPPDSLDAFIAEVAHAPPVLATGTLVDETYRIDRLIGSGGMGMVYLARDLRLQRSVALKLHRADSGYQRALREAKVMARLNHPNVVTVYDVGVHDGRLFIAMEYVEGGSLRSWLVGPRRRWREVLAVLLRAARGLAAAHDAGLVHGDFKPDNVLCGVSGRVLVADFGIARGPDDVGPGRVVRAEMSATNRLLGTPAYTAPEVHRSGEISPAADQFAFCVTLWEALAGRRPFAGAGIDALCLAIERGERRRPARRGVPRAIWRALERGLAYEPSARHATLRALIAELERIAGRARRRVVATATAVALAGAGLGGWIAAAREHDAGCAAARELDGIWDPVRRDQLRDVFADAGKSNDFSGLSTHLDRWAAQWVKARDTACQAGDGRLGRCLEAQRRQLAAHIDAMRAAPTVAALDGEIVRALEMAEPVACGAGAPAATAAAEPESWAGYWWSAEWGVHVFRPVGREVRVVYPHDLGTMVCTPEPGLLRCWWRELPTRCPDHDAGELELRPLVKNGKRTLDGRWRYGRTGAWNEDWDLTKLDGIHDDELEARFADVGAFTCVQPAGGVDGGP